jgi:hypothetical protein
VVGLPTIKFTIEVEANDTLLLLDVLVMKGGLNFTTKVYQKPTHTGHFLHLRSNHPHHVIRGVVHCLISQVKVLCQDQKDLHSGIKNIRYALMLKEYPQEFTDSILKTLRSNLLTSDTVYQGSHYPIY